MPLALTDDELHVVVAAAGLPVDRRSDFLERVAAQLRGGTNLELDWAIHEAVRDLMQTPAV
jgi:hypothetical protein